jgi:hypothetical protein
MLRGVHKKEIFERMGLSRRLVARLGALLAKGVEVTEAAAEAAAPGSVLEKALLSKAMTDALPALSTESLAGVVEAAGEPSPPLAVQAAEGGVRVIALEEELLGESAWDSGGDSPEAAATPLDVRRAQSAGGQDDAQARRGGAAVRIDDLKMTVLTSADPSARIEAMRKIAYMDAPDAVKTDVLLAGLADADPKVSAEAASLLSGFGLSRDLARAVHDLAAGPPEETALFAVDRITSIAADGDALDTGAAVIVLVGALKKEPPPEVARLLLEAFGRLSPIMARNPARLVETAKLAVALTSGKFEALAWPVRVMLRRLGAHSPDAMAQVLWDEIARTGDRRLTAMLLLAVADIDRPADAPRVAAAAADFIAAGEQRGVDIHGLASALRRCGAEAVRAILGAWPRFRADGRRQALRLIDDICRYERVPPEVKRAAARQFQQLLAGGDRGLRLAVMGTVLPGDPDLDPDLRAAFAEGFLASLHEFSFPVDREIAEATVARMGAPAIGPLLARLDPAMAAAERIHALSVLGRMGRTESEASPDRAAAFAPALRAMYKMACEAGPEPPAPSPVSGNSAAGARSFALSAALNVALARAISGRHQQTAMTAVIARRLLERPAPPGPGPAAPGAAKSKPSGPSFAAAPAWWYEVLGWLGAGHGCSAGDREKIIAELRAVLDSDLPEIHMSVRPDATAGVTVYEFGGEADIYAGVLPAAVESLARVATGPAAECAREIARFLIGKWTALSRDTAAWGPADVTAVVAALREIGADPRTDPGIRVDILKALARHIGEIPVMEAFAAICAADDASPALAPYASAAALAILRLHDRGNYYDSADRPAVLSALAAFIGRAALTLDTPRTRRLRETVVDLLVDGVRDRTPGAFEALAAMRDKENLPAAFRAEVRKRMEEYASMEKA